MPRPVLFIDLAGTLILRDPESRQWVAWTGVAGLLHDLARDHDLHLTTGDSDAGARGSLAELGVTDLFSGVHTSLPGGGKPFGALARVLGKEPSRCLVLGDDPVNDTARDTDQIVSLILWHETQQIPVAQVQELVTTLGVEGDFLAGFEAELSRRGEADVSELEGVLDPAGLMASSLGDHCRLGWWQKSQSSRRPVVTVKA